MIILSVSSLDTKSILIMLKYLFCLTLNSSSSHIVADDFFVTFEISLYFFIHV